MACSLGHDCWNEKLPLVVPLVYGHTMTNVDLEDVRAHVEVLRWAKDRIREIKEIGDGARAEIERAMGDADVGVLDDKPVINWSSHKKRQLNQKALRDERPEIAEEYTETVDVRTFTVIKDD